MLFWTFVLIIATGSALVDGATNNTCSSRPETQKNTTKILADLRREMQDAGIGIYVIFAGDELGIAYAHPFDKRRDWLSGFRGSAGTAVVSEETAALWADSRYFIQAEEELDCANWLLMREGEPDVPTLIDWLVVEANRTTLPPGATPELSSNSWWSSANAALNAAGKQLNVVGDLVGQIWPPSERPPASQKPIVVHDIIYSGETVTQKLSRTAAELKRLGVTTTVLSALEEIAWLFNLRGDDIPFNPFFKSYAIVHENFLVDQPELFVNLSQLSPLDRPDGVRVLEYATFWSRLNATATNASIGKIWVSPRVSQAVLSRIPNGKLLLPLTNSPVQRVKARKNAVERAGMRACQTRDAVARMKHLGWLEQQLTNGVPVNETESAEQLFLYQSDQEHFKSRSFNTISASGDRAAIVHYMPVATTARRITRDKIYLLDAGSQYLDCTTDITRTHHFGTPTSLEKRAYTRVLQGVLNLAEAVFPTGTYGRSLDHLARMSLYRDGMIYGHVTGHGIGHYLRASEGPQNIAFQYNQNEEPLADGMFVSDEPGFYKTGDFGIRIENDVEVIMTNKSTFDNRQFLRFDTITFLPYERLLIDVDLLTRDQYNAINQYHAKVASVLEPLLIGDEQALRALRSRTANLDFESSSTGPATASVTGSINTTAPTTTSMSPESKASTIMEASCVVNVVLVLIITLFSAGFDENPRYPKTLAGDA
ncbi:unnamed protein product [Didymodactylos carnosus]|uniref:Xaa-Pro aminopeptidase n=1 Tax=Didymodactylos carnosus TaxID=1234261 RepID=A0A814P2S8_9BILA|nr:unnamed protein product [Didymodactylos carnosus]CAF3865407.1 unnamed protein product [Didymodactylos carnosus]